jgi:hypothetical protein
MGYTGRNSGGKPFGPTAEKRFRDRRRSATEHRPGGWRIERQLAQGKRFTVLRTLPAGLGPQSAFQEFQASVHRGEQPGATSRLLRLVGPRGEIVQTVNVEEKRRDAAAASRMTVRVGTIGGKSAGEMLAQ